MKKIQRVPTGGTITSTEKIRVDISLGVLVIGDGTSHTVTVKTGDTVSIKLG